MEKDFDGWNKLKKRLEKRGEVFCSPREIWWCSVGANIGAETSGKNKLFERPVLIVRVYNKRSVIVSPITSVPKDDPYHMIISFDEKTGWLILSHTRTISPRRLLRRMSEIGSNELRQVREKLAELTVIGPFGTKNRLPLRGASEPHQGRPDSERVPRRATKSSGCGERPS